MIAVLLNEVAATIVAADDGGPVWLLALGPAGGAAVYFGFWSYYRNTDASHSFERETRVGAQPVTGTDTKVDEVNGTKRARIDGENTSSHRERVQRVD